MFCRTQGQKVFWNPEDAHITRARELLGAAAALVDDLIATSPAALMGATGGTTTAKRMLKKDPDYYKRIAGMRKTKAGGRPRRKDTSGTKELKD